MKLRPQLFQGMGDAFVDAFGNVDVVFTINGIVSAPVRGILRQWREVDQMEEEGQAVEGTTHLLSVASSQVVGLVSQRDSVVIHELDAAKQQTGVSQSFEIKNHADDARAMLRIYLSGDI